MGEDVSAEQRVRAQQGALVRLLTQDRLDRLPLPEAYARLTETVSTVTGVERVSIWALDGAAGELHCLHMHRANGAPAQGEVLSANDYPDYFRALATSRAIAAHDARSDPATHEFDAGYLRPLSITSMLDATVRRGGHTVGIVCLEHVGTPRRWSLDEQQFAATTADIIVMLLEGQERRELQERLHHQARHDPLTGLPNLTMLRERLDPIDPQLRPHAMMLLDMDRFGEVNHSLGHETGDEVLRALAGRLTTDLPDDALVARISGDKFALWLPLPETDGPAQLAADIQARVRAPIEVADIRICVSARIGISLFPEHGSDSAELLRRADVAMHDARSALNGCQFYDNGRDRNSARRLTLIHDLRGAAERGELFMVYQPRVRLPGGEILGAEALLRWRHPTLGNISPAEFIPLAEISDEIADLTLAVLDLSLADWRAWQARGHELSLSINLSARIVGDHAFAGALARRIAASGVPPKHLEFEITESALCEESDCKLDSLQLIREAGARISLDDFGVGHSSMSRLSRMPVDALKIDQMFVRDMDRDPRHLAIVQASVQLAHAIGLAAVAEGVETPAIAAELSRLGCDEAQGYLYGAPISAEKLAALLTKAA